MHEEPSTLHGLVEALDREGFIGVPAAGGQQALEYLQSGGTASVILLDEYAGWSAFRHAQQGDPQLAHIPVIAISPLQGSPARHDDDEPIDVELLITIVRRLCGSQAVASYSTSTGYCNQWVAP